MNKAILVINAGSSSIKFSLYLLQGGAMTLVSKGQVEGINVAPHFIAKGPAGEVLSECHWDEPKTDHATLLGHLIGWIEEHLGDAQLVAAGHRVVHGGLGYSAPVAVDGTVMGELAKLIPLAPLHQPHNLSPIEALAKVHPELTQVACFDTAFHRTNDKVVETFALPRWLTEEGVRRYGFHGLSYEYIAQALPEIAPELAKGRVVVAHLGSGASMCAIKDGRSVASTMGFTALDGLPMGTRTGALDAGVVLYLMQQKGMDAKQIETLLYKQSGLIGVSGISNDMRVLLETDHPHADEAVDLFVHRILREMGSLAAAMGGIDGLVFTAGIGEHAAAIRDRVCQGAAWLGLTLDPQANAQNGPRISTADSAVSAWVIPTDEEKMIARHVAEVVGLS